MSSYAIRVNNIGKRYRIGVENVRASSTRQAVMQMLGSPFAYLQRMLRPPTAAETLWACRGISFDVQPGEVVGLIGHNGAGKSTLLKLLSRITEPTEGHAHLRGRVGSLLEVGTGFHHELTGRENIYLSGSILGMHKGEIDRKFDEIVDFSGVERFLDTPIKRYSSGMQVRLGFAVAAHLEPEILLVDEVLAVGDAEFQKKCLGKMSSVAQEGRTVLFVSHNMGAMTQLCSRAVWLERGCVREIGDTKELVGRYLANSGADGNDISISAEHNPDSDAIITSITLTDTDGEVLSSVDALKPFQLRLNSLVRNPITDVEYRIRLDNRLGQPIFTTELSHSNNDEYMPFTPGNHAFTITIPGHFLAPDSYSVHVSIHRPNLAFLDFHDNILSFTIEETGTNMWRYQGNNYGNVLVDLPWQHTQS